MNAITMNPEIKQKWVNSLRSGEYSQGEGKLRSNYGYCCLGVLCDLYAQEQNQEWEFKEQYSEEINSRFDCWYFDGESAFLPKSVMEWAGLSVNTPNMKVFATDDDLEEEEYFYFDEISNLNDSGTTFMQLADLIEQQL